MSRLPPKLRSELTADQQVIHDKFLRLANVAYGKSCEWEKEDSAQLRSSQSRPDASIPADRNEQLGPLPFYMAHPPAGIAGLQTAAAVGQAPQANDARETAILTLASHTKAAYVVYAHSAIAIDAGLLSAEQVDAVKRGEKPRGFNEGFDVAYDVARRLATVMGPMPRELWDRAVGVFGLEGMVGIVHWIGMYANVSMMMNAADVQVPK